MKRSVQLAATLIVLALALAYILPKVDLHRTAQILESADLLWVAVSASSLFVMVLPMAWRWKLLLRARGIHEDIPWLTRAYLVGYTVGQLLPTSVGADAARIYETARRHPARVSQIAGSVILERAIGGAVPLLLAAIGFLLAIGRFSIGAYLWIELVFVVGTIVLGVVFFSRAVRVRLVRMLPWRGSCASSAWGEPCTRAFTATGATRARSVSSPS